MWVEIKPSVFEGKSNIDELRKLIQDLSYNHKCNIFIDIPRIQNQEIFKNFSESNNENIFNYYTKYINDSPSIEYYISDDMDGDGYFTIKEAIIFFGLPFLIILENSDNDSYFLEAIIREFKKSSKIIRRFKENFWLKYVNSGGSGNVEHTINAEIANVGGNLKFLKCFVLVDSDLEYPEQTDKGKFKLKEFLDHLKIPYHILEKREIENYLPTDLFNSINPNDDFIKTYCYELTSVQKDFIDIEKGFKKSQENLRNENPEVYSLYVNESDNERSLTTKFSNLRHGIDRLFDNYKNEYPLLFQDANQEGLLERTKDQKTPNELSLILEKITKLL